MYQIADTNYAINAKQFKDFRWIRMHICITILTSKNIYANLQNYRPIINILDSFSLIRIVAVIYLVQFLHC